MDTQQTYPTDSAQSQSGKVSNLRTYMSDVAKLIKENQLSAKELSRIDQTFLEAVKRDQIATSIAPKKKAGPSIFQPTINQPDFTADAAEMEAVEKKTEQLSHLSSYTFATPEHEPIRQPEIKKNPPIHDIKPAKSLADIQADLLKQYGSVDTTPQPVRAQPRPVQPVMPKPDIRNIQPSVAPRPVQSNPINPAVRKPIQQSQPPQYPQQPQRPIKPMPQPQQVKPSAPIPVQPVKPPQPKLQPVVQTAPVPKPELEVKLTTVEQRLQQQEQEIKKELLDIQSKEQNVRNEKVSLQGQRTSAILDAERLKMQEQNAERKENDLQAQKQSAASPQQQASLEKQRWNIEDERQQFEKQRWVIDKKIMEFEQRINEVIAKEVDLKKHEDIIQGNLGLIKRQELALKAQADRVVFIKKMDEVTSTRVNYENQWKTLMLKKQQATETYAALEQKEKYLQTSIHTLEEREHTAPSAQKVHEYESERWIKDHELRDLEQEKWKQVDDLSAVEQQIADLQQKTQDVLLLEKQTMQKIGELDQMIRQAEDAYNQR